MSVEGVEEGRFGPAVAVDGALVVVVFFSKVEGAVVVEEEEGGGRLAGAEAPATALLGRILAVVVGLVAAAMGCDAQPTHKRSHGWRAK